MDKKNRFSALFALAAVAAVPVLTNGCSAAEDIAGSACCTDFKVGADLSGVDFGVDASIKGQFSVLAQAASDFGVTGQAMLDDVTAACKGIAQDLGAKKEDQDAADALTDGQARATQWCTLAVASLQASGAVSGSLDIEPPQFKCEASIDAKANCEAKCDVSGSCDVKANMKCSGGKPPTIQCEGSCKGEANASIQCKGKCDVTAKGSCTAQGGVECQGKCDGTCKGSAEGGTGTGIKADGTCDGTCEGTCEVTKPGVKCEGTFDGECNGTCSASGDVKVECNGKCEVGEGEPIKCEGGVEGGCDVDAKCSGQCDASVNAKANCTVQPFSIKAKGSADFKLEAAIATLKLNLPKLIIAVKARGEAMGKVAASFTGDAAVDLVADPGKLGVKGVACIGAIGPVLVKAAGNAKTSIEAGVKVTGQIGL